MYWDIRAAEGHITIVIQGIIDFEEVDDFRRLLEKQISKKRHVMLDLSRCEDLCSMAVGIILGFKIEYKLSGGDLWITNACDRIREIFKIVGAESIFIESCSTAPHE